jgi:hypothetical protein
MYYFKAFGCGDEGSKREEALISSGWGSVVPTTL